MFIPAGLCFVALLTTVVAAKAGIVDEKYVRTVPVGEEKIVVYDRGSGPVLVLVHGMFGDYQDWGPVLEPLAQKHRVIAVDLPGFGASSKPNVDYTGDYFVRQMDAFLREMKVDKATFIGNSFGAIVALMFTLEHPDKVSGLVLIGSGGLHRWTDEEKQAARNRFTEANLKLLNPAINQLLFTPLFVNGTSEIALQYMEKQNAKLSRPDYPAYAHSLHSSIQLGLDAYLVDSLNKITAPTLLLQGQKDQVIQLAWVETAARKFPAARLQVLPACGHVPQMECPTEVVSAVESFTAKLR
jgi:pimeloyl-ACP methyl ester carboxylesterase